MPFQSQLLLVTWDMLQSQVEEVPPDWNIKVIFFFFFFYWMILAKIKKVTLKLHNAIEEVPFDWVLKLVDK